MSVRPLRLIAAVTAALSFASLTAGCGIALRRDLSEVKPTTVVYDDMCELQDYFDGLKDPSLVPPTEVTGQQQINDQKSNFVGGKARFVFSTQFQLFHLRRILRDNWTRVPDQLLDAPKVEVEVQWSQKAGIARVVTTEDALVVAGDHSWFLPYQICLSDLLFGEPLYDTRREVLQLPPPGQNPFSRHGTPTSVADAFPTADGGVPPPPSTKSASGGATKATALPVRSVDARSPH